MKIWVPVAFVRLGARLVSRSTLNPRLPWAVQRRRLDRLVRPWPLPQGVAVTKATWSGVPVDIVMGDEAGGPGRSAGAGSGDAGFSDAGSGGTGSGGTGWAAGFAGGPAAMTVVHFHGGGYCVGSPWEARDWAAHLVVRTGCRVVLPEYRLAPEHPYPAAVEDARAVVGVALREAAPGTVVLSGDSAGGGLALGVAQALPSLPDSAGPGTARVAGCILMSSWLDLTVDWATVPEPASRDPVLSPAWLEACARAYEPGGNRAHPVVSPLLASLSGLPPLLIQCGSDDLVAPDSATLAVQAEAAGVDVAYSRWPGMWHDFTLQPDITVAAARALDETVGFLERVCGPGGTGRGGNERARSEPGGPGPSMGAAEGPGAAGG